MKLYDLICEIKSRVDDGESLEDVIKDYPLNKSPLPYLFKLVDEVSPLLQELREANESMLKDIDELNEIVNRLNDGYSPQVKRLEIENKDLQSRYTDLLKDHNEVLTEYVSLKDYLTSSIVGRYLLQKWELLNEQI